MNLRIFLPSQFFYDFYALLLVIQNSDSSHRVCSMNENGFQSQVLVCVRIFRLRRADGGQESV